MLQARILTAAAIAALVLTGCSKSPPPAPAARPPSLVLLNARVWTGDSTSPWAQAVAIDGATISMVGTNDDAKRIAGDAPVIDAAGQLVLPGFIDTHVHFIDGGYRLASVQLRDAKSREEFVARIRDFAATVPEGTWITGGDWDHTLWGGELPARDWIDTVTPAFVSTGFSSWISFPSLAVAAGTSRMTARSHPKRKQFFILSSEKVTAGVPTPQPKLRIAGAGGTWGTCPTSVNRGGFPREGTRGRPGAGPASGHPSAEGPLAGAYGASYW